MAREQGWERWKAAWQHALFAAVLGLTAVGALAGTGLGAGEVLARVGLVASLAAWYGYWFPIRHDARAAHLPYLIGAAVLWAVMAAVDPAMLTVGAAGLVPYTLRHPLWSAGGIVGLGGVWLARQLAGDDHVQVTALLSCLLGIVAAVAVTGYIAVLERESGKRQRLLDELTAAQAEREAAERRAGTLAERQRLARDIHDTLTQGFASIGMLLDAAHADLDPVGPAAGRVEQAMRIARENLVESRRLVAALRPLPLDGSHLADAVRSLAARLAEETGIRAQCVVTGQQVPLPAHTEGELLRIVQEALTNARRHAHATALTVTVTYLDDLVAIDVQDDGNGFETGAGTRRAGVGLAAMRERAEALCGTLTVESSPGEGTTVAVSVPVPVPTGHTDPGVPADPTGTDADTAGTTGCLVATPAVSAAQAVPGTDIPGPAR
jgi:signal transduction histidine kinase